MRLPFAIFVLLGLFSIIALNIRSYYIDAAWPIHTDGQGVRFGTWKGRLFVSFYNLPPKSTVVVCIKTPQVGNSEALNENEDLLWDEWQKNAVGPSPAKWFCWSSPFFEQSSWHNGFGFGCRQFDSYQFKPCGVTTISIPFWFLIATPTLLEMLLAISPVRRRLRSRSGRCIACGYDLRASKSCCPECGLAIGGRRTGASQINSTMSLLG